MTVAAPTFQPYATQNAAGSFGIDWIGLVAGTIYDDPVDRFRISGGILAAAETIPMFGGVGISELIPPVGTPAPSGTLGPIVSRATNLTAAAAGQLTGWSVFNQAHAMVNNPSSPVPTMGNYGSVNYVRLGSFVRLAVGMVPGLVSLEGEIVTTLVSWDFVNQQLIPGLAVYASEAVTSAAYTSSTGIIALTFGTAPLGAGIGSGANGAYLSISGLAGTGVAPLNGDWPITGTASSGTVVSVQGPIGLGALTITGSTGTLAAGGGYLPVRVLDVSAGKAMVPVYNSATGAVTWNRQGYAALIQI